MIREHVLAVASLCALMATGVPALAETRDLYPNASDEVVRTRAARQAKPLWQVPLGPALVEDMAPLDSSRLLVGLRKDFPGLPNLDVVLVDTGTGRILWRLAREGVKGEFDRLLLFEDLLLFRVELGKTASLLAVDPRTGTEKWVGPAMREGTTFVPHPAAGCVLAVQPDRSGAELSALDLEDGTTRWRRPLVVPGGGGRPQVLPHGADVVVLHERLECLSGADGRVVWARPEFRFDQSSPPPAIEDATLWIVDAGRRLGALDAATGEVRWTAALPGGALYNQVYPLGQRLYLRGLESESRHFVASVDPRDGRVLWTHVLDEASVSNLLERGDALYFGTPSSLVALGAADGRPLFSVQVTTTGRAFPIRIRRIGDRIVWIGELAVAAFDAASGRLLYRQGMTPLSGELHLNGLDAAAPELRAELRRATASGPGQALARGMVSAATSEMLRYQSLSSSYRSQVQSAYRRGDAVGYSVAGLKQRFAEHEASLQQWTAVTLAVVDLAMTIRQLMQAGALRTYRDRQVLFRKSILAAHARAESDDFVHRPHLDARDPLAAFAMLSIVDLASGKRTDTALAPQYLSYGLWQVVDFDRRVAYHVHVGLDPAAWELGDARAYYPYSKARTLGTFLVAQPVAIPR